MFLSPSRRVRPPRTGVPVAAALGYIIFGPSGDKKKKTKKGDTKKSSPAKTKADPAPSVEKKVEEVTDGQFICNY